MKISYYHYLLQHIPHGSFVCIKGKTAVTVYYCPDDPSVSPRKAKRYQIDSPSGKIWEGRIKEYLRTKTEFERLKGLWRMDYTGNPDLNAYSPDLNADSVMSRSFWDNAEQEANPMIRQYNIKFKGQHFRSKNELATCQMLDRMGYEFKTEVVIRRTVVDPHNGKRRDVQFYPDVVFYAPEQNRAFAIELDGMMEEDGYRSKAEYRKRDYIACGFVEGKDILFYRISSSRELDIDGLEAMISAALEAGISK